MEEHASSPEHAAWDAGDMGCSLMIVELRRRLAALRPGDTLAVTARGPGAPVDLPAWCRMTGHTLVSAEPPLFVIRVRAEG